MVLDIVDYTLIRGQEGTGGGDTRSIHESNFSLNAIFIAPIDAEVYFIAKDVRFVETLQITGELHVFDHFFLAFFWAVEFGIVGFSALVYSYGGKITFAVLVQLRDVHNKFDVFRVVHYFSDPVASG